MSLGFYTPRFVSLFASVLYTVTIKLPQLCSLLVTRPI